MQTGTQFTKLDAYSKVPFANKVMVHKAAVTNYVVNGGDGVTGFANATVLVPEIERRRMRKQSCSTHRRWARSTWV
jgi:hypothetical protein